MESSTASKVQYLPLGTTGVASSTISGKKSALAQFDSFLRTKDMPKFDSCTEEQLCSKYLLGEFCHYLADFAKKEKDDNFLEGLTAVQFLSGVKTQIEMKYPRNALWEKRNTDEKKDWYTAMRCALLKRIVNRKICSGLEVTDKSPPINRNLMKRINRHLLKRNSIECIERRFALAMTWLAVGRAGEVGIASWNFSYFDMDEEYLFVYWNELKVSAQKPMTLWPM